jgi:hypothetical protein
MIAGFGLVGLAVRRRAVVVAARLSSPRPGKAGAVQQQRRNESTDEIEQARGS